MVLSTTGLSSNIVLNDRIMKSIMDTQEQIVKYINTNHEAVLLNILYNILSSQVAILTFVNNLKNEFIEVSNSRQ